MWFSNGSPRAGLQTVLYKDKLDSFVSYHLVEPDLLVRVPARGDCIKAWFDEITKDYVLILYSNSIQEI